MTVSPDELRYAMRRWTTGVTVVTAQHDGIRHGMTVSTFTSLSLEPPFVMVSLERSTRTHDLVVQAGAFGVTILADNQQPISDSFANAKTAFGLCGGGCVREGRRAGTAAGVFLPAVP